MNPPTTPAPAAPKGQHLRSINIRTLENGFVASCSYVKDKVDKKDMCCSWEPDKEYVLTDQASVQNFINQVLGFTTVKEEKKAAPRRFGNSI